VTPLASALELGHVALAFVLVSGLVGRWVLLTTAARSDDVERAHLLSEVASPFERAVQVSSPVLVGLGLATAWAQGYPWLGLTTGWMLLAVLLIVPILVLIPTVFIPRGHVFETAMTEAREAGAVTPALREAWADPAVAMARRYELVTIAVIIGLMVVKPF
jgi:hypothetical protein